MSHRYKLISTREEARNKGYNYYYTGRPCAKGHKTPRLVSNGKCATCHTQQFIEKAIARHGYKYDYTKTKCVAAHTPVIITCKYHGDFKVTPFNHISNRSIESGCVCCYHEKTSEMFGLI